MEEKVGRRTTSLQSQGATLEFLGRDGRNTEYMEVWKYLGNKFISHKDKIQRLLDIKVVDRIKDHRILNFISSMPSHQWPTVSAQMQEKAPKRGEIISIKIGDRQLHNDPCQMQVRVRDVSGTPSQLQRRLHCESILQALCQASRLVNAGGTNCETGNIFYVQGDKYFTYFLKPERGDVDSIAAVKIPVYSDLRKINPIATNEFAVLKKLHSGGVPNVVEPYGNECLQVRVSKRASVSLVSSIAIQSDQTDRRALQLVNLNGLNSVITQILGATAHVHQLEIVHGNLAQISNLVYNHIGKQIYISGWSHGQILDTEISDYTSQKLKLKDTKDIGALFVALIARKTDGDELIISEDDDVSSIISSAVSDFNAGVLDPNLRLDINSTIVAVTRGLIEGSLTPGNAFAMMQSSSPPREETKFTILPVQPRYLDSHDSVTFPTEIRVKTCVDNKGNRVEECGVFVPQTTPKNAILGPYEGLEVTSAYLQRLEKADPRKDFHIISLPGGGLKASFRKAIDGNPRNGTIQDVFALQGSGAVNFPCCFRLVLDDLSDMITSFFVFADWIFVELQLHCKTRARWEAKTYEDISELHFR